MTEVCKMPKINPDIAMVLQLGNFSYVNCNMTFQIFLITYI